MQMETKKIILGKDLKICIHMQDTSESQIIKKYIKNFLKYLIKNSSIKNNSYFHTDIESSLIKPTFTINSG